MEKFKELAALNVNDKVEKKDGMSYLPWSDGWDIFANYCPTATYEVVKAPNGLPYFESSAGAIVYTKITVDGITHEMWLPVMDGKNKAMRSEPYKYMTKAGEKTVEAYTMFDINKTIMRCLVKNMAMFGLGLYLYRGEDLPDDNRDPITIFEDKYLQAFRDAAIQGKSAMNDLWKTIPKSDAKDEFWQKHGEVLTKAAEMVEVKA